MRRRTRRFDLGAVVRDPQASRFVRAFSSERLLDTLLGILFASIEVLIVTLGVRGMDEVSITGVALVIGAMNLAFGLYVAEHHRDFLNDRRQLLLVHGTTVFAFALGKLFVAFGWPIYLYPLALFGMGLAIGQGQRFGIVWTVLVATAIGLMKGLPSFHFPVAASLGAGAVVGILMLGSRVTRRSKVIRAGIVTGLTYAVMFLATEHLLHGRSALLAELAARPREIALTLGFGLLNGLFTGYFMVEFGLGFIESTFDVVTDLRLQELADLNQPILKKFSIEAPGTFHHSQMVGTLAEAAAEAIGANPLLCRVGAHFHDIGKLAKPEYYIENVTGGAPTKHDGLTPNMSTLIIVSHVKDGIEMAEELGLPPCVIDFIPEHHGTIAVEYFYHQAVKLQQEESGPEVSKDDFRYPGPKPQSKETGILMIADSVEAISRVLTEPNPSRIEAMVHEVVMRRLKEGQLDECAITLAELKRVEEAMGRMLMGIFHSRIKYPKAATVDRQSQSAVEFARRAAAGAGAGKAPGPEDMSRRIQLAALAADGPGVPSPAASAPAPAVNDFSSGPAGSDLGVR